MVAPEAPQRSENAAHQKAKPQDDSEDSDEPTKCSGQLNLAQQEDEGPRSEGTSEREDIKLERPQLCGGTETPDHQKTSVGFCDSETMEGPEPKMAEHTKEVCLIDLEGEVLLENKKEDTTSGPTDSAEEALICRHAKRTLTKCAHMFTLKIPVQGSAGDFKIICSLCQACKDCVENSKNSVKSGMSLEQADPAKEDDEGPASAVTSQTEELPGDSTKPDISLGQPDSAKQEVEGPISAMTSQTEEGCGGSTKSAVSLEQSGPAKEDNEGPTTSHREDTEAERPSLYDEVHQKKKTRHVGFCDAEVAEIPEPKMAEHKDEVKLIDIEGEDTTGGTADRAGKALVCRHAAHNIIKCAHIFSLRIAERGTTADCKLRSSPCPACKDCIENYKNYTRDVKEQEKNNGDSLLHTDSVSPGSNSGSNNPRSSTTSDSRHEEYNEDSAEESEKSNREKAEDCGESSGNSCEDNNTTLPYPDDRKPPECITRLSNAGLYEHNEDQLKRSESQNQVKVESFGPEEAKPPFFIQHQQLQGNQKDTQKKVQIEMSERVDIEKGEPERELLIRNTRSRSMDEESVYKGPMCCRCERSCVKAVGSFLVSIIVFPLFLYAAHAWLPFDTPVMPDIPTRLVYTLRCGAFASLPIVLGVIIHGISRLCVTSFDPFKPQEREVKVHRRFVKQSTFLFVLYFFNMAVLSTYLPQDYLKLIPLLTCLFALSQLIYWLSFAVGRSFRGFGYGLTFLPLLAMLFCNLYFMFLMEPEKMIHLGAPQQRTKSGP